MYKIETARKNKLFDRRDKRDEKKRKAEAVQDIVRWTQFALNEIRSFCVCLRRDNRAGKERPLLEPSSPLGN